MLNALVDQTAQWFAGTLLWVVSEPKSNLIFAVLAYLRLSFLGYFQIYFTTHKNRKSFNICIGCGADHGDRGRVAIGVRLDVWGTWGTPPPMPPPPPPITQAATTQTEVVRLLLAERPTRTGPASSSTDPTRACALCPVAPHHLRFAPACPRLPPPVASRVTSPDPRGVLAANRSDPSVRARSHVPAPMCPRPPTDAAASVSRSAAEPSGGGRWTPSQGVVIRGVVIRADCFYRLQERGGSPRRGLSANFTYEQTGSAIAFMGQGYEIVGNDVYASGHGIYLGHNTQGPGGASAGIVAGALASTCRSATATPPPSRACFCQCCMASVGPGRDLLCVRSDAAC